MHSELSKYVILAKFLKEILGERYDIILKSVDELNEGIQVSHHSLIREAHPEPAEIEFLQDILQSNSLKKQDYLCGFLESTGKDEALRSSAFYIRDVSGEIIGFLCVKEKMKPVVSVRDVFVEMLRPMESVPNNIGMEVENLMRELFESGLLNMKGAMDVVAKVTGISLASLYRYLSMIIEE